MVSELVVVVFGFGSFLIVFMRGGFGVGGFLIWEELVVFLRILEVFFVVVSLFF